jgi:vancomycin resistance protein YoaR
MWRAAVYKKFKMLSIEMSIGLVCIVIGATASIAYYKHTSSHLPPNITINSIYVGNLTYEDAAKIVSENQPTIAHHTVTVAVEGITAATDSAALGLHYNYKELLSELKTGASTGRMRDRVAWRVSPLFSAKDYTAKLQYDNYKVATFLESLNSTISYPGEDPSITLAVTHNANSLKVFPGKRGRELDTTATAKLLSSNISSTDVQVEGIVASTAAELSEDQVADVTKRATLFVDKSIVLTYENKNYSITDKDLVSFLKLPAGFQEDLITNKAATLAAQINRSPQEPTLEFNKDTLEVTKFSAPLNGQSLDQKKTVEQILETLGKIEAGSTETAEKTEAPKIELVVSTTPPKNSLATTNSLGINETIGFGDSHYDHSIPNRVHNVAITTERITNTIVPPGAEFSFNKTLGDVSAETGYRSAYVIKNGQTALGDGGGVCQVSTTLFRSVLNAGLKVTRRLPHSYRVSYYELDSKPGVDATVYSGETDFRFINDTPGHILIHAEADSKNLYMNVTIYGTSDGRTTELKDHITWNARPAPAPQYFPDPTLPVGKLVQIDWAASGISSSFINVIKDKDGKVIREDKYISNYRPWSAKYRQGVAQ